MGVALWRESRLSVRRGRGQAAGAGPSRAGELRPNPSARGADLAGSERTCNAAALWPLG